MNDDRPIRLADGRTLGYALPCWGGYDLREIRVPVDLWHGEEDPAPESR